MKIWKRNIPGKVFWQEQNTVFGTILSISRNRNKVALSTVRLGEGREGITEEAGVMYMQPSRLVRGTSHSLSCLMPNFLLNPLPCILNPTCPSSQTPFILRNEARKQGGIDKEGDQVVRCCLSM